MNDEPPRDPPRPIGAIDAALLLAAIVILPLLVVNGFVTLVAEARTLPTALARDVVLGHPIFAGVAQLLVSVTLLEGARRYYARGRPFGDAFFVRAVPPRALLLAIVVGATMQIPLAEIANLVEELVPVPLEEKERLAAILAPKTFLEGVGLVLAVVAVAPVTEELLFRGLFLPGVARGSGALVGVIVSSIAFAIAHVKPGAVAVAFVGGLVLAILALRTGSVLPAIAAHAANNAVPVVLPARLLPVTGVNLVTDGPSHVNPWLVLLATLAATTALALVRDEEPG